MPDVLHNFDSFNSEVHLDQETEDVTSTPPKNGLPVPRPVKASQPKLRGLYEMIDGELPSTTPAQTKPPRPANKRPGRRTFMSVVREVFATFFRRT